MKNAKIYGALAIGLALVESNYFSNKVLKLNLKEELELYTGIGLLSIGASAYLLYKNGLDPDIGIKLMGSTLLGTTMAHLIDAGLMAKDGDQPSKIALTFLAGQEAGAGSVGVGNEEPGDGTRTVEQMQADFMTDDYLQQHNREL